MFYSKKKNKVIIKMTRSWGFSGPFEGAVERLQQRRKEQKDKVNQKK